MKKKRLIFAYHDFLKQGKYNSAHTVLQLLIRKNIVLGLGNDDFMVIDITVCTFTYRSD